MASKIFTRDSRISFRWRRSTHLIPVLTKLIVLPPLLWVRENLIGFVQVFELCFCVFVSRIEVRMIFAGKLAVSPLNCFRVTVLLAPKTV